jgi:hypothetical protein
MNRIVKHNYPVEKLPEDLRSGLVGRHVTVTVDEQASEPAERVALTDILDRRRPPFLGADDVDARVDRARDSWDR